jgi:FkbM family methyltransferase
LQSARLLSGYRQMTPKLLRDMPREDAEAAVRRLCMAVPMADGMVLCRVLGRYKLFVDSADFGLAPHLILDGFWESWVTEAMLRTVVPGMVAVDIGAHVGYYTFLLADLVGPGGHVHAFEPNPNTMRLLARSMDLNTTPDLLTLHAAPLTARSGEPVRLVVPRGEPKNAHISVQQAQDLPDGAQAYDLTSAALDDVLGEQRVDFIKIDAEGAERDIWQGMGRILARGEKLTIFLEFASDRYAAPEHFLAEIAAGGFRLARIDQRDGIVPVTAAEVLAAPGDVDQMLALSR